ncbi:hypothetical protein Dip510_000689 [Elusimicrobium posterum]|uniref:hypothetical protein n=1 Tax=Elusimicrobium posterum TaxID=3116653 RepID=UPI003C728FE7
MNTGQESLNNLLVILAKAALLVIIIMCIFFIAYPQACHNMIVNNIVEDERDAEIKKDLPPAHEEKDVEQKPITENKPEEEDDSAGRQILIDASKDTPEQKDPSAAQTPAAKTLEELKKEQDDYDYKVAKRFVEVEKEYLKTGPINKDKSLAITEQVMKEFKLTDTEWLEIIAKAEERGWFTELRAAK